MAFGDLNETNTDSSVTKSDRQRTDRKKEKEAEEDHNKSSKSRQSSKKNKIRKITEEEYRTIDHVLTNHPYGRGFKRKEVMNAIAYHAREKQ